MKPGLKLICLLIGLTLTGTSYSQYNKNYLQTNTTYPKGKIYIKKNLTPVEAKNIQLVQDTLLQYTDIQTGQSHSVPVNLANVNYIKVRTGSRAGSFALYGGGLMCLSALVGVLTAEGESVEDYGDTSGINWTPFVLGFTAGGAVVGAAIGAFVPKYTNYYVKTPGLALNVKVVPQVWYGRATGLGVRITF